MKCNLKTTGCSMCQFCGMYECDDKYGINHEFNVPEETWTCVTFKKEAFYLMEKYNSQFKLNIKELNKIKDKKGKELGLYWLEKQKVNELLELAAYGSECNFVYSEYIIDLFKGSQ